MGAELGFEVIGVGLQALPGGPIYSSTRIRELLAEVGDVDRRGGAARSPARGAGAVEEGDRRGRELGFPTANVVVPARICLPADGIYAGTFVGRDGVERAAAISLGRRPTFYEHAELSLLEAYVLDFDGDLYGQRGDGPLRRAAPGRGALRDGRGAGGADAARRGGHPARPRSRAGLGLRDPRGSIGGW